MTDLPLDMHNDCLANNCLLVRYILCHVCNCSHAVLVINNKIHFHQVLYKKHIILVLCINTEHIVLLNFLIYEFSETLAG